MCLHENTDAREAEVFFFQKIACTIPERSINEGIWYSISFSTNVDPYTAVSALCISRLFFSSAHPAHSFPHHFSHNRREKLNFNWGKNHTFFLTFNYLLTPAYLFYEQSDLFCKAPSSMSDLDVFKPQYWETSSKNSQSGLCSWARKKWKASSRSWLWICKLLVCIGLIAKLIILSSC